MLKLSIPFVLLFSILFFLTSCSSNGGGTEENLNIYEGDVFLTTQQEVDDFGANNYNVVNGLMRIESDVNSNDKINDLTSLSSLERVNQTLFIVGNELTNLNGLNNLVEVWGLWITNEKRLLSLMALKNIKNDVHSLVIADCLVLENLTGLEGITKISSSLQVSSVPLLKNLDPLNNLTQAGEQITINVN